MDEFLARSWDLLVGRATGPLHVRLVIQPLMAALLAFRAGARDARAGRTPFGWAVLSGRGHRADLLREGWNDIAVLFLAAFLIDALYQLIAFHWFHLIQSVIVATLLAVPAYLLVRGPTNRLLRRWFRERGNRLDSEL